MRGSEKLGYLWFQEGSLNKERILSHNMVNRLVAKDR